jgi:hypothetical protein
MESKSSFPRSQESTPPVRILRQITPVYALPPYFINVDFNIIILPTPRSFKLSLYFFQASPLNSVCIFIRPHMPHPSHLLAFTTLITFGEEYKWWRSSISKATVCNLTILTPPHAHVSSSALCSRTRSAYVLPRQRPISGQYKTTGKIRVLYTSVVLFQDDKWEDKTILEHLLIIHTNKSAFYNIVNSIIHIKIHTKTLKTLLHVSILRSSSGRIHCSLLKLYIKTIRELLRYVNPVMWHHAACITLARNNVCSLMIIWGSKHVGAF